jgi:hypothetical protein
MKVSAGQSTSRLTWHRIGIAVVTAAAVVAGARGAFLLSEHMMNATALVGSWVMLVLVAGYVVARFRPSVGIPLLVGFGMGVVVVAFFAGMAMMS